MNLGKLMKKMRDLRILHSNETTHKDMSRQKLLRKYASTKPKHTHLFRCQEESVFELGADVWKGLIHFTAIFGLRTRDHLVFLKQVQ